MMMLWSHVWQSWGPSVADVCDRNVLCWLYLCALHWMYLSAYDWLPAGVMWFVTRYRVSLLSCGRFVNCSGVTFMSLLICTSNDSTKAYLLLLRNWFSSYSLFKLPNLQYTRDWLSQRCKNVQEINTKIRPSNPLSNASLEWAHAPLIYYKYFSVKNPTTLLGLSDQISQIVLAFLMN